MTAESIAKTLGGRWHGSYGTCRCPVHDDREPSLSVCNGDGDEVLVKCHAGCDWRDIKSALRDRGALPEWRSEQQPRSVKRQPDKEAEDTQTRRKTKFARRMWHDAQPIQDTPAETYLRERGLKPGPDGWPGSLRYHPSTKHRPTGLYLPCLIAAVTIWPGQEVSGIHRTFLRGDGRGKAPVSQNKMMLGRCAAGAVCLAPHRAELVLSEGIETGLSVQQETGLRTWACLSTSGLCSVILPPEIGTVIIAADGDDSGEEAAQKAAWRFLAEGRTAKIARPPMGMDFNDVLRLPAGVAVIHDHKRRARHD